MPEDKGQETIREDYNKTILEGQPQRRETLSLMAGSKFRDYQIVEPLPSSSTEADIFIIEKDGSQFFLKLYRSGIDPKIDILKSVKAVGEKYPKSFIKIFETDFDTQEKRWFEVQEYVKSGSLQAVIDKLPQASEDKRRELFSGVAQEAGEALNILHENGFLHRDVKPSNILVRSLNPLNLVVIDFGIASALESDMSKKATRLGGTPMYQSPESFSSVADEKTGERRVILGPPTDWWGLGMILLEIASGSHPFKNLSPNVIGYSLVTEAVSIPDKLDEGQKELLHGLLTRNPAKRWSWEQVSRWLKGERGIPHFFEETAEREDSSKHPLTFMHQKYRTLEEVAAAFTRDEESWKRGREFLLRGHVKQWLESNLDFDTSVELDQALANISDSDEKLFFFINKYGRNIPFVFGGHAVTVKNLFIFTAKAQKREAMTDMEQKIVDMLLDGRLISCFGSYLDGKNSVSGDEKTFMSMLERFKGKDLSYVSAWLDFYINPKKYHCPFLKDTSSPEEIIRESDSLKELPMTADEWSNINNGFIVPSDIIERMKSAMTYSEAVSKAVSDIRSMKLIRRGSYTDREVEIIRVLLPSLKTEESIRKVLDFCVHPEMYHCPFLKDMSSQEQLLEAAIILGELPMTADEWYKINNAFIVPSDIIEDIIERMKSVATYSKAVSDIKSMTLIQRWRYTDREVEIIRVLLPSLKTEESIRKVLDFCVHPEMYHCPFLKDMSSQEQLLEVAKELGELPMTADEWYKINNDFIVPSDIIEDIIERMKSVATYSKAVSDIRSMKLIRRWRYTDREVEIIRVLLPSLKTEESIRKVLNFCVHPEMYHCPFVKDTSSQEQLLEAAKALGELPMTKSEWDNLTAEFILPEKLLRDMGSVSLYLNAVAEIERMKSDNLLFYRRDYTQADDATKSDLASSSIEDYKRALYRVRWGYDDVNVAKIESSLSEMRKKQRSSSGFEAEQCGIWVAYLEYLSSRSSPLTDEDKEILRNVSLENTDELEKRIAAIVG